MYKKDPEELLIEIKNDADMERFLSKNANEFTRVFESDYLSNLCGE